MVKTIKLSVSVLACLIAGFVGSVATMPSIPTWYASLQKPAFNPPNWIFGPVWTTLFIMMGVAAFLVWDKGLENKKVRISLAIFGLQLLLNVLWSILFFGLQSPLYAFIDIIMLWASILATIIYFYRISAAAAYLLIPYILWVSFASILNLSIVILNR
jgi:tryptophan-rich sensory protein